MSESFDAALLPQDVLTLGTQRSVMRELFSYGKQRAAVVGADNVFDFSIGNPSVPPPPQVNECILSLVGGDEAADIHAYTDAQGDGECRAAIAASLCRRFGADARAQDLYLTVGAAASLTITLHALCRPGDEVVLLAPFFSEYRVFAQGAGARVVICAPNEATFQPDMQALERALGPATRAVIINSPNNPTGVVYTRETLCAMAALLRRQAKKNGRPIFLISDEPYRELVFGEEPAVWVPPLYEDTVVCYSYSKSLSLPGERIGYIYLPKALCGHDLVYAAVCGAGRKLGFVNAPSLFQRVAAACDGLTADISVYAQNARLLYDGLTKLGFYCLPPQGTFYLLLRAPIPDATAFCRRAQQHDLLLVPTDTFDFPGWVRIAYCVPTEKLRRALPAFAALAAEFGLGAQP